MENKNMFYRGYVELLVLKFLSEKDCYGYEIVKSIKRASKDKISLSVGTLYPTLYKMIDQKYISDYKKQTGERMVKVYAGPYFSSVLFPFGVLTCSCLPRRNTARKGRKIRMMFTLTAKTGIITYKSKPL